LSESSVRPPGRVVRFDGIRCVMPDLQPGWRKATLQRAGVSVWSISRAERGERISAKTAQALLAALGAGGDVDLLTQFFSPRARVHALRCGSAARNMATVARVAGRALCRLHRTRFRRPAATAKRLIIGKELNRHPCSPVPSSAHSCSR
jgi:hypothetical protein